MREIKFRAWDYNNEKIIPWENIRVEKDESETNMSVIVFDGSVGDHFDDFPIMQYTGIDSEDELEIFEGDIVKQEETLFGVVDTDLEFTGVVKMLEGCWVIDNGKDSVYLWSETACNQIIGNIYENPELLEVEANA